MKRRISLLLLVAAALSGTLLADSPREALERQRRHVAELATEKARDPRALAAYQEAADVLRTYERWCSVGGGAFDRELVLLTGVVLGHYPYNPLAVRWNGPRYQLEDGRSLGFSGKDPGLVPGTRVYAFGTMWMQDPTVFMVNDNYFLTLPPDEHNYLRSANTEEEIRKAKVDELLLDKAAADRIPGTSVSSWGRRTPHRAGGFSSSGPLLPILIGVGVLVFIIIIVLAAIFGSQKRRADASRLVYPVSPAPAPIPTPVMAAPAPTPVAPVAIAPASVMATPAPAPVPVAPVAVKPASVMATPASAPAPVPVSPVATVPASVAPAPAFNELCPYHRIPLVNGKCPQGCTIVRCGECGSILRDGVCPNGCREAERCPTCGTTLYQNGTCPNACTIVRCAVCGAILREGVCPHGCNADPMRMGWSGPVRPPMHGFALEVVAPAMYAGFRVPVPDRFVIGRSARNAHEPFLELYIADPARRASCSRRYVELSLAQDASAFFVRMLASNNVATVSGTRINAAGQTGRLALQGILSLNPDFELRLVRDRT